MTEARDQPNALLIWISSPRTTIKSNGKRQKVVTVPAGSRFVTVRRNARKRMSLLHEAIVAEKYGLRLTVDQLADALSIAKNTIYNQVAQGVFKIPTYLDGCAAAET